MFLTSSFALFQRMRDKKLDSGVLVSANKTRKRYCGWFGSGLCEQDKIGKELPLRMELGKYSRQ